jgi:F0F1-type ATP synthase delta subunit
MAHEQPKMVLPTLVFGKVEVRRLQRELESLDEFLRGMAVRRQTKFEMPRVSRMLDALANENHLDLLKGAHRTQITEFITGILDTAPIIHMSFAADPSSAFTAKVVSWLRANIHPFTLLDIGLQPNIAAGCVVRTTNKVFDLSLRRHFAEKHDLLLQAIQGDTSASTSTPAPAAAPAQPKVAA